MSRVRKGKNLNAWLDGKRRKASKLNIEQGDFSGTEDDTNELR